MFGANLYVKNISPYRLIGAHRRFRTNEPHRHDVLSGALNQWNRDRPQRHQHNSARRFRYLHRKFSRDLKLV